MPLRGSIVRSMFALDCRVSQPSEFLTVEIQVRDVLNHKNDDQSVLRVGSPNRAG